MVGGVGHQTETAEPADGDIFSQTFLHVPIRVIFPELNQKSLKSFFNFYPSRAQIAVESGQGLNQFRKIDDDVKFAKGWLASTNLLNISSSVENNILLFYWLEYCSYFGYI